MSSKWTGKLTRWRPHQTGSETYNLTHVHPFRYQISLPEIPGRPSEPVEIQVGFSSHVFTEGCTRAEGADAAYSSETDLRRFCVERYKYSRRLRNIIETIEHRKCFFTSRDNYFVLEASGLPKDREYRIFFDVRKIASGAVLLWIQSAYVGNSEKPPSGRRRKKIGFRVLVRKALDCTRPNPPP